MSRSSVLNKRVSNLTKQLLFQTFCWNPETPAGKVIVIQNQWKLMTFIFFVFCINKTTDCLRQKEMPQLHWKLCSCGNGCVPEKLFNLQ